MQIVQPIQIVDQYSDDPDRPESERRRPERSEGLYLTGNLTETDYDEWATGQTYARGRIIQVASIHSVYQCLRDHESDAENSPVTEALAKSDPLREDPDPEHWVYVSQTNRWRLFDDRPSQQAENGTTIRAGVELNGRATAVALLNLNACNSATVQIFTGAREAYLAWTIPDVGAALTISGWQYRVKRDNESFGEWTAMADSSGLTSTWRVDGLNPDSSYQFQIRHLLSDASTGGASNAATMIVETSFWESGEPLECDPAAAAAAAGNVVTNLVASQCRTIIYGRTIPMADNSGVVDWYTYFFGIIRSSNSALFLDLPVTGVGDFVQVELSGTEDLACGQIIMGLGSAVGDTMAGDTGFEGLDYSHVETNIYGDLVTVERASTKIFRFHVLMPVEKVNEFSVLMQELRGGRRALWIGDPSDGIDGWIYGFYRDHQVYYDDGVFAHARITINGVV